MENLKKHGANDEVCALFTDLIYEKEPGEFGFVFTLEQLLEECSPTTRSYMESSILHGNCDPSMFCDSKIQAE